MNKIIFSLLCLGLHASLLNASAAANADADRAAKINAQRASVENALHKGISKYQAQQRHIKFLSKDQMSTVLVELSPSELKVVNEQLKAKKAVTSPCPLSRIIGLAPFKAILDTFGQNGPHLGVARKNGYLFEGTKFAIGQAVLVPHNGNNRYGVIIDEIPVTDGPLKTVTFKYKAQIGHYKDETTDTQLAGMCTQELEPQLIGHKMAKVIANPNANASSLATSPHAAQSALKGMEEAAALNAALAAAAQKAAAGSANPNSLGKPAATSAAAAEGETAPKAVQKAAADSAPAAGTKKFQPKLKRYARGKFSVGTIIRTKPASNPAPASDAGAHSVPAAAATVVAIAH